MSDIREILNRREINIFYFILNFYLFFHTFIQDLLHKNTN